MLIPVSAKPLSWASSLSAREAALAFLILAAVVVGFFHEHLLGRAVIPYDSKDQVFAYAQFTSQRYRNGELPLWNPYNFTGYPAFADPLYLVFAPAMLLLILPITLTQTYFDAIEILHIFVFGCGTYLVARDFGLGWRASVLGALAAMLGGPMTSRAQAVDGALAMASFPFALLFLSRSLSRNSPRLAVAGAFALAPSLMTGLALGMQIIWALGLYFLLSLLLARGKTSYLATRLPVVATFFGGGVGLASAQTVPFMEFVGLSNRASGADFEAVRMWGSLWPQSLLTLAIPDFFGATSPFKEYWGKGDPTEAQLYAGALASLGVCYALLRLPRLREKQQLYFPLVGGAFLLYALGPHTPLFRLLFDYVPFVGALRRTTNALYLLNFGLTLTAAIGVDQALRVAEGRLKPATFALAAVAFAALVSALRVELATLQIVSDLGGERLLNAYAGAGSLLFFGVATLLSCSLASHPRPLLAGAGFAALVITLASDIIALNRSPHNTREVSSYAYGPHDLAGQGELLTFLRDNLRDARGPLYRLEAVAGASVLMNGPAAWRIPSTAGYSSIVPARYHEFSAFSNQYGIRDFTGLIDSYDSALFDFLAAKYVVDVRPLVEVDGTVDPEDYPLVFEGTYFKVYENPGAVPRAFLVTQSEVLADPIRIKARMQSPDFDPRHTVILEQHWPSRRPSPRSETARPSILKMVDQGNALKVRVQAESSAFLVVSDIFYPGWEAYVDGRRAEILRANYAFRAVYLEAGEHEVRFVFRPRSLRVGLGASGLTMAALLGIAAWDLVGKRGRVRP